MAASPSSTALAIQRPVRPDLEDPAAAHKFESHNVVVLVRVIVLAGDADVCPGGVVDFHARNIALYLVITDGLCSDGKARLASRAAVADDLVPTPSEC